MLKFNTIGANAMITQYTTTLPPGSGTNMAVITSYNGNSTTGYPVIAGGSTATYIYDIINLPQGIYIVNARVTFFSYGLTSEGPIPENPNPTIALFATSPTGTMGYITGSSVNTDNSKLTSSPSTGVYSDFQTVNHTYTYKNNVNNATLSIVAYNGTSVQIVPNSVQTNCGYMQLVRIA